MKTKPFAALSVLLLALTACQSAPAWSPPPAARAPLQAFQVPTPQSAPLLRISPALRAELLQPDTEPEPRNDSFDEELARRIFDTQYVKSHSYYYQTLDNQDTNIEAILRHDGHARAADLLRHWRDTLGQNAVWPDAQSTTYNGPWPALEHAELSGGKGWFGLRSAGTKAQEYYQRALDSWNPALPPDHPQQAESWAWFARASHFLQDISVPFHTMSLVRPAQLLHHKAYERSCDEFFGRYLPSRNHNPDGVWLNGGPYPASGQWGHYYPPGTSAAQMVSQLANEVRPFYKLVNRRDGDNRWERTRAVMVPLGAKTTAGMVVSFLRDVGVQP